MLKLKLPEIKQDIIKKDAKLFIRDSVRRKYVHLTAEEWVRQHFIQYLITEFALSANRMSVEKAHQYQGRNKRVDILVLDVNGHAFIMVECKAPSVKLSSETCYQIAVYNATFQCPWLIITNGLENFYFKLEKASTEYRLSNEHELKSSLGR